MSKPLTEAEKAERRLLREIRRADKIEAEYARLRGVAVKGDKGTAPKS